MLNLYTNNMPCVSLEMIYQFLTNKFPSTDLCSFPGFIIPLPYYVVYISLSVLKIPLQIWHTVFSIWQTVYTPILANNCPTRCDYIQFYHISAHSSTCFEWYPHPSSGAHVNCNYSIWHWSNRIGYRPLSWRSRNCISDSSTPAEGSTSARCYNYSLHVLLMMGEYITRNM
jgi:hypothetical protein